MRVHDLSHMSGGSGLIGSDEDVLMHSNEVLTFESQLSKSFTVVTPPSLYHFDKTKFTCFTLPLTQFFQILKFC